MKNSLIPYTLLIVISVILTACGGERMPSKAVLNDDNFIITSDEINRISSKKIYFAHQSVGFNILDGIDDLNKINPESHIKIVQSEDFQIFNEPVFAHSTVGDNFNPISKLSDFKKNIESGIGNLADIAFLKFCYLDVDKNTDVDKFFLDYQNTINELVKNYPNTKFIHFTVPLTVTKFSIRSLIKKIIGRHDNNIMRNKFNDKLNSVYADTGLVFDLAEIESTYPDGSRAFFTDGGEIYYSLVPEYASDSGHLNEVGRLIVAKRFLKFLSNIGTNNI